MRLLVGLCTICIALGVVLPRKVFALTRDELNTRIATAIASSMRYRVVLDDILGEGKNAWDSDPRYPTKTVNCMVWLELILAEVYGAGLKDRTPVMDRIRYYEGTPAFSLRKHYIDHWVNVEPAPLRSINLTKCGFPYYSHIKLRPDLFLAERRFSCPLYKMDQDRFELQYIHATGLTSCSQSLPAGYYVAFAVPTEKYTQRYLQGTGPMGLVHSLIIKTGAQPTVFHASTAAKRVMKEPLKTYLERMKELHLGYLLYELDPAWDYTKKLPLSPEARRLLECEAKLPPNSSH